MDKRIIFHIDVNNAFLSWTAVLLLKNGYHTDIRKIPSVIAGSEKERRGIVLAKSPVAKKLGVKSAETTYAAKKKCKSLAIYPPDYKWYIEKSHELMNYLKNYSPDLEQYSVDECFLDMTGTNYLYKDYEQLAHHIKEDIKSKFGYTVNIGIGNNKLCAKMASDFEKPDKVHTLYQEEISKKLWPLPVEDLFMVGNRTAQELHNLNIKTVHDLVLADKKILYKKFKNQSKYLKEAALGLDNSEVKERSQTTSSISISETLPHDTSDIDELKEVLFRQTDDVCRRLRSQKQYASTVAVIYKNYKFANYTTQEKLTNPTDSTKTIYYKVIEILEKNYQEEPIRLIGVRLSGLTTTKGKQLSLFAEDEEDTKEKVMQDSIDKINRKFGRTAVMPASLKIIRPSKQEIKKE